MTAREIELEHLRPFLAPVLLEATGQHRGRALLTAIVGEIKEVARHGTLKRRKIVFISEVDQGDGLLVQAIVYREEGAPSWLSIEDVGDTQHHLIVTAVKGAAVTICASDGSMRDRIVKALKTARRMPRDAIAAFVGSEAKAIWLNGIHSPTSSKADTKAMTGPALEDALDPIGDQTYYYSAARTLPQVPGLVDANNRPLLIGAAPSSGRIWIRRSESWGSFRSQLSSVMDHATSGVKHPNPFASLARAVDSADDVGKAYDISIVPEELLSEDDIPPAEREAARRWAFDAAYAVTPLTDLSLRIEPTLDGLYLGALNLTVTLKDGFVALAGQWANQAPRMADRCIECAQYITDPDRVKIYYESGHTIAQGHCYAGGYTDLPFNWSYHSFAGYDVTKEKPTVPKRKTLASQIAITGDNSLFAFVCQRMFLGADGTPKGWLASDDGSMELADFIHIDPDAKKITLVHVKASKSSAANRGAAPADFEIVVSQAVKNLRHLDRRNLVEELTRGKAKKIGAAVWHDGLKQADREEFLKIAGKLPASTRKELVVLQPRLTRTEETRCLAARAAPSHAMRMKQLNTLMLAAQASALACGATFIGMADTV
jgi:hypothetical protein